jgi:predicted DNA-binding protein (UPF0251 family)
MLIIGMARPVKCRFVSHEPGATYFKPRGIPMTELSEIVLGFDELEAVRLADLEGLYQEDAAEKMKVSRQTFGNIIHAAHAKIAEVLIKGKALKIEGGVCRMKGMRKFACGACSHEWDAPFGTGRPPDCPKCKSADIHRAFGPRGQGRTGGAGRQGERCRGRGRA